MDIKVTIPQSKRDEKLERVLNNYFETEEYKLFREATGCQGVQELKDNDTVMGEWTYEVTRNDGERLNVRPQGDVYVSGNA